MFPDELVKDARRLQQELRSRQMIMTSAESCTGGLLAGLMTEIPGSSDVFERGFVTYSNDAKSEMLGVSGRLLDEHGAVSAEVAIAMVEGALAHSLAQVAVSITGVAGPGGGSDLKPVGLVYLAASRLGAVPIVEECRFGDIARGKIRLQTLSAALAIARRAMELATPVRPD